MLEIDLGDMLDEVEKSGGTASDELWDPGRYKLQLVSSNTGRTRSSNKPKMGFLWKVLDGPNEGAVKWENITINPESGRSKQEFIAKLLSFGLTKEYLRSKPPMDQIPAMITGIVVYADVSIDTWRTGDKMNKMTVVKIVDADAPEDDEDVASDSSDEGLFGDMEG